MRECGIEGCDKKIIAKNMCDTHYRRNLWYGDPLRSRRRGPNSGENHFASKLNWDAVRDIRTRKLKDMKYSEKYNVSYNTVRSVIKGETWKEPIEE